jgi:response regulator RpfG family c-di-GMP phosphodiesterase
MLVNPVAPSPAPQMQFPVPERPERDPVVPRPVCHHVIVVDDDDTFARSVADALTDRDIEAVAVSDPRQALSLARLTPFAAAVVDLVMPDIDGLELARELRKGNPSTEVVMLTGHADMRSAVEGIRNELFDYLQKSSLQTVRLRRAVRAAIARSELRAENRRLISGLQESTRKLKVLNDVSTRLAAEPHLDRLLAELVRAGKTLLEAETARVLIMERNDLGDMRIRASVGDGEAALGGHFGAGDGIATRVAESGEPMRTDVPCDHPSYSSRCDDMGSALPGLVCAPLSRPTLTGVLMVAGRARPFSDDDLALLASLARQGAVAAENAQTNEVNRNFFTHASEMLVSLLDSQDVHYEGHASAVAALADMVSRRLALPEDERRSIHYAALLHDVGKLRLPQGLLTAERTLTEEEMRLMREHPALGVALLRPISKWGTLSPVIHTHHERWDGKGYPRGLAGDAIPLGGRIVAVAEAFEAMTRSLPHRKALTVEEALAEVERCAGSQFDPEVARVFVEEYRRHRDQLSTAHA